MKNSSFTLKSREVKKLPKANTPIAGTTSKCITLQDSGVSFLSKKSITVNYSQKSCIDPKNHPKQERST